MAAVRCHANLLTIICSSRSILPRELRSRLAEIGSHAGANSTRDRFRFRGFPDFRPLLVRAFSDAAQVDGLRVARRVVVDLKALVLGAPENGLECELEIAVLARR